MDKVAAALVCVKCLRQQRPAGRCNRLGHTHSGVSPSKWPQKPGPLGGEGAYNGSPAPCTPLNSGVTFPRQTTLPVGAFLAVEPLTPIPSGFLCAANTGPLPRSTLLTTSFSTQPPSALAASCLRLGCPGLIPEEALAVVVLRTLETVQVEEALAWRGGLLLVTF